MTFELLGLSPPLLRSIRDIGHFNPTPIQKKAIPKILAGSDVVGSAETGTGKTAGFVLPILQLLDRRVVKSSFEIRALVLCPTRELADQIHKSVLIYGKFIKLNTAVVYGGVSINPQKQKLKWGVDLLIATPGRLLDLVNQKALSFQNLEIFVTDEADRMLDMGFIIDIKKIVAMLPNKRQNLLFSATFPKNIKKLIKNITDNPIEVNVKSEKANLLDITEKFYSIEKSRKAFLLNYLIKKQDWYQALVFVRTKRGVDALARRMQKQMVVCGALHGDKSQRQRMNTLKDFKKGKIQILICTDIVARGIDICGLPYVVNYDMPNVPEDYVHRIGRTGRAGEKGVAISFVSEGEQKFLTEIEKLTKRKVYLEELSYDKDNLPNEITKLNKHLNRYQDGCVGPLVKTNIKRKEKKRKKKIGTIG